MQYDGIIRIATGIDIRGLRQGESDIKDSMERMMDAAKKFAAVIGSAFAIGKITQFGKEAIEVASDFEAMESQFSQVFGNLEERASESLSKIADQAGITEERMKASYTKIAAFAKTTGMSTEDSLELSNRAMVAIADSAAFYDRTLKETTESLQSFLKGNYENDAALGLSATEYTRNAAANKLYGKSFIELSEAQKQLTLLQMVEDANKLSGALGQASRESDTWTNQIGNLNQAIANFKANIGKFILPTAIQAVKSITNVINALNEMIVKLHAAASAFRSFFELITGRKSEAGSSAGISKNTVEDIGSGYEEAAEGAEKLAEANDDAAKSAKNAEKAAKSQYSTLDKLNNITSESSDSIADGMGETIEEVDYGKIKEGENEFGKLSEILDSIIGKIKELAGLFKQGFFEGFGDYKTKIDNLKSNITSIGQTLKDIFTSNEILFSVNKLSNQVALTLGQVTGSAASIGLTIAQNLVGGIEKYLSQNEGRIKKYIVSMLDIRTEIYAIIGNLSVALADIFSVFGGETAQQITGNLIGILAEVRMMISENAAKLGRDILNMIAQPIIDNKDKIKDAIEGTLQAIEPFTSGLLTMVQTVSDAVSDIYDNHLKPLLDSITSGLSGVFEKLLDGYNTYIVSVLQGLGQKFKEIMEGPFGETIDKVSNFIGKLIDAVKLLWESVLVPFFSWIADNIMPVLAPIADFIGDVFLAVLDTIIDTIGNIADNLSGIIDFIVGVFTGDWEKAWEGIKEISDSQWNKIKDVFEGVVEIIKSLIGNWLEYITVNVDSAWEGIKSVTSTVWNAIKNVLSTTLTVLKVLVVRTFNLIKSAIFDTLSKVKTVIVGTLDILKTVWNIAWTGMKNTVINVFNGIWTGIKNVINKILDGIEGMVNGIIKGVNFIIGALNSLSFKIPEGAPFGLGGKSLGINIPELSQVSIPRLATGTVVPPNREFMAVLGDNKREPEVVSPISTMKQANKEAILEVLSELGLSAGNSRNGGNETFVFQVDGRTFFEITRRYAEEYFKRTGRSPFPI